MKLFPRTIAGKLVFYLSLTNCLVLATIVWFSYIRGREMLVEQIDSAALKQVRTTATRLDDFLGKAAIRGEMIGSHHLALLNAASTASSTAGSSDQRIDLSLFPLLVRLLRDAPKEEAYGLWFCRAVVDGRFKADDLIATHRHTCPNRTICPPDYLSTIPKQEWYSGPKESGKPYITEPYYDDGGGNTSMVSLSHPCFDEQGRFIAVSGVDVELAHIYRLISEIQDSITQGHGVGFAFLISGSGRIITHPETKLMLGKNNPGARIADLAEGPIVTNSPSGSFMVRLGDSDRRLYWSTAPLANWKIVLNVPNTIVSGPVHNLAARVSLLGLAGMVLSSLVLVIIAHGISRPLVRLTAIAQQVAIGNLHDAKLGLNTFAKPVAGNFQATALTNTEETDLLLAAIRTMTDNLNTLIGQAQLSGVQITSTAKQIAATALQQEATVSSFGGSTTRIATSVREISATSQELLSTMNAVNDVASKTAGLAESGRLLLHSRQDAVNQMLVATESISGKLSVMNQRAGEINMVVTTISKVAVQTNLLSLNAAIEAEKAGEFGLGFSVVAREIRRLADQTALATLDIEHIVKEMQSSVTSGVMEMNKFSQSVRRDVEEMGSLTGRLDQIIQQVQGLTFRFEEVNIGMRAQSDGAREINEAMVCLNDAAQQTAASLNEFNQATCNLKAAAVDLQAHMTQFKISD
ncbi:MAG: methyl-accepting chemotaxis protein [Candidatus Ozemobacteraceae bacterium]